MCEQCNVNPLYFGEPLPGWYLIRARRDGIVMKKGQWGLLQCNNPDFIWDTTPTQDPLFGITDEDEEERRFNTLTDEEKEAAIKGPPQDLLNALKSDVMTGYELVKACMEMGYEQKVHGYVASFLNHILAVHIAKTDPTVDDTPTLPHLEEYNPTDYTIGKD